MVDEIRLYSKFMMKNGKNEKSLDLFSYLWIDKIMIIESKTDTREHGEIRENMVISTNIIMLPVV